VAIPTLKGLGREERARQPMATLAALVQEVRQRAVKERRPYQIVFERTGVHALADGFPTGKREEFLRALDDARTPPPGQVIERMEVTTLEADASDASDASDATDAPDAPKGPTPIGLSAPPVPEPPTPPTPPTSPAATREAPSAPRWEPPWTVTIPLADKSECEVLFWGDAEWDRLEGDEIRRWVFQPTGMASAVRVLLRSEAVEVEATFDPLTGEIIRERIQFISVQP